MKKVWHPDAKKNTFKKWKMQRVSNSYMAWLFLYEFDLIYTLAYINENVRTNPPKSNLSLPNVRSKFSPYFEHWTNMDFYLQKEKGEKRSHQYYYQTQGQLSVCEMEYCDFICWTPCGVHIERILRDSLSFFNTVKPALDIFFINVLLPLLLTGRTNYESKDRSTSSLLINAEPRYCWCGGIEEEKMIACNNASCPNVWFHFDCIGLKREPRGEWFCIM